MPPPTKSFSDRPNLSIVNESTRWFITTGGFEVLHANEKSIGLRHNESNVICLVTKGQTAEDIVTSLIRNAIASRTEL